MADKVDSPATPAVATPKKVASPKKAAAAKAKKPAAKSHPPASAMVNAAIKNLKERGGSSLPAIKKYIAATYKVDVQKQAPFIRKYLKAAVANKSLVQTKGKGAAGSFKLAVSKSEGKPKTKAAAKPKSAAAKAKKPAAAKKAVSPKAKKAVAEKKRTPKVAAKPPKAKSTTAKPKAAPKKAKAPASPKKKAAPKAKKTAAKKVAKK